MLKIRIIPTILWKDFGLVKGVKFSGSRRVGPVLPTVKIYNARDVDEIMLCDVGATANDTEPNYSLVKEVATECCVPLTVSGGISKIEHVEKLLIAGADKVALNSSLYSNPFLLSDAAERFGSQCIMASIDAMRKETKWTCVSDSGAKIQVEEPCNWARQLADRGAGEILITSIDQDGTMSGYDLGLIESVCSSVDVPVIASGGAGEIEHVLEVLRNSNVSALGAASIFHFTEITPLDIKRELMKCGFPVRISI